MEKRIVTIKNKEYTFLKPSAFDLISVEDNCIVNDKYSLYKHYQGILNLISKDLKIEDLVVENIPSTIELSNGGTLEVNKDLINVYEIMEISSEIGNSRSQCAIQMLRLCGIEDPNSEVHNFSYHDINTMYLTFISLYDIEELINAVETVSAFCHE